MFSTDAQCRALIKKLRWPKGVACIRCESQHVWDIDSQDKFECALCGYQFSVITQTIFHDTHLPLEKWFLATILLCESRKGMSANQIKRLLGISYKTAWYLCHRIRASMAPRERGLLDGVVEMDETYVGGKKHGVGKRGRGAEKEIVIGIRKRGGELRFFKAADVKSKTLADFIKDNVSQDVDVIVTDNFVGYPKAMMEAGIHGTRHATVNHSSRVFVDGPIHTNTVESAFSLLKRGIIGTWHQISAKHLQAYLEEMTFRFDRRNANDLFMDTIRHMATADPLTYEKLTA